MGRISLAALGCILLAALERISLELSRAGLESSHRGRIDDDMESRGGSYVQTR